MICNDFKAAINIATKAVRDASESFGKDITKNIKNDKSFVEYSMDKNTIIGDSKLKNPDETLSLEDQESNSILYNMN